jgi:hypothetical protein
MIIEKHRQRANTVRPYCYFVRDAAYGSQQFVPVFTHTTVSDMVHILIPQRWVFVNILPYALIFLFAADDMVVKSWLPQWKSCYFCYE